MSRAIPLRSVSDFLARNGTHRASILNEDFRIRTLLQSFLTKHITIYIYILYIYITRPRSLSSIVLSLDLPCCANTDICKLFRLNMKTCPSSPVINLFSMKLQKTDFFQIFSSDSNYLLHSCTRLCVRNMI